MANTYTQLTIHAVFSVKYRDKCLKKEWRDRLFEYIAGILRNEKCNVITVGGYIDHVHLLFNMSPTTCISQVMKKVKQHSTNFINENRFTSSRFAWQEGYGAFAVTHDHRDRLIKYIASQEELHRMKSFREEFVDFLSSYNVPFDAKYLPGFPAESK